MIKVNFPNGECVKDHIEVTLDFIKKLEEDCKATGSISLDFSEVSWFLPCSMILLSNKVRELMAAGASSVNYIRPTNEKAREHMEKIGFPLGDKKDGGPYISIKHISNDKDTKSRVNERVNEMINSLKEIIPEEFGQSVVYIVGELADNIDSHSEFKFASIMAQYFPMKKILDIVVFDNGITIPGSFEKNNIRFKEDNEAIRMAVLEGRTTKKEKMRGYGLRTCGNLSIEGLKGEAHIISRKGNLLLKSDEEPEFSDFKEYSVGGTLLHFRLKKPKEKVDIYKFVE